MDSPHDHQSEDDIADQPAMPAQAELEAMLDADDADVAAGRIVPLEPVLVSMRATAERIRRDRHLKETTANRQA